MPRTISADGTMTCNIERIDGKKYIALDDLIAYLKSNAELNKDIPNVHLAYMILIKAFIWTKNNK